MKDNFKDIQCYLVKQAKKVSRQTLTMMFLQSAVNRNMKHWAEAFMDRQIELYLSAKNQKV